MVAAGIILPIISPMICLKADVFVLYLIQSNCVARNIQAAFYSFVLPIIIAVAIGLYLLILIFWKLFSEVYIEINSENCNITFNIVWYISMIVCMNDISR